MFNLTEQTLAIAAATAIIIHAYFTFKGMRRGETLLYYLLAWIPSSIIFYFALKIVPQVIGSG